MAGCITAACSKSLKPKLRKTNRRRPRRLLTGKHPPIPPTSKRTDHPRHGTGDRFLPEFVATAAARAAVVQGGFARRCHRGLRLRKMRRQRSHPFSFPGWNDRLSKSIFYGTTRVVSATAGVAILGNKNRMSCHRSFVVAVRIVAHSTRGSSSSSCPSMIVVPKREFFQ